VRAPAVAPRIANRWNAALGVATRYPEELEALLERGDAVVFPVRHRPVKGSRSVYRASMRHGVSRLRSGQRHALGVIFHDAP